MRDRLEVSVLFGLISAAGVLAVAAILTVAERFGLWLTALWVGLIVAALVFIYDLATEK